MCGNSPQPDHPLAARKAFRAPSRTLARASASTPARHLFVIFLVPRAAGALPRAAWPDREIGRWTLQNARVCRAEVDQR